MKQSVEQKKDAIYQYINSYFCNNLRVPSLKDISLGTSIPIASIHRYLVEMDKDGRLEYNGRRNIVTTRIKRIKKESRSVLIPVLRNVVP